MIRNYLSESLQIPHSRQPLKPIVQLQKLTVRMRVFEMCNFNSSTLTHYLCYSVISHCSWVLSFIVHPLSCIVHSLSFIVHSLPLFQYSVVLVYYLHVTPFLPFIPLVLHYLHDILLVIPDYLPVIPLFTRYSPIVYLLPHHHTCTLAPKPNRPVTTTTTTESLVFIDVIM